MKIETTEEHPFWVVDKGWVLAGALRLGNRLKIYSGEIVSITKLELIRLKEPMKVYNFEVKDWHIYYVGENSLLVHNKAKVSKQSGKARASNAPS